ncbi:DUF2341 domain-containing protein [Lysobacter sp.]|uniref:DUF2341 domain-containing protein n=1 Tax=Lysobacter sp. TaxID=72226 RepID=UPI002D27D12C|nr:DUF2341 domain-containing protein [Lysobacter sp.]HZX78186.1 DUF2341 domain-containing protein [Lysobacter sp.]
MQRFLLLALVVLSAFAGTAQAASWWQPEWAYRKPITIDAGPQGGNVGGEVGRTPVLVRLHTGTFSFDGVKEDGADIRFVAADDKTVLNHQIERFDPLLGMALIWVDVPALSGKSPQTTMWMYYGNPKAPASGNGQLTFDPDYTLVYHFGEVAGQAASPPRDTTAYGNHAQATVTPLDGTVIGKGAQFNGTALTLPATPSLAVQAGGAQTVSLWVRPDRLAPQQVVYARRDGAGEVLLGLDQGVPFVQINGQRTAPAQPVQAGQWSHLAFSADAQNVTLFVNGRAAGTIAASMPALNTPASVGADADGSAAGTTAFIGAIDELRISRLARPAPALLADTVSQGAESRLTAFGPDEQQAGKSHFAFILEAMPVDAWVVVSVLGLMFVGSWLIMIGKGRYFGRVARANAAFTEQFHKVSGQPLSTLADLDQQRLIPTDIKESSTLWRLYQVAVDEMRQRHTRDGHGYLSAATIGAIRASMDGAAVRENERMSSRMNWLSTTIEGAPYVGLFGTVIGIMLVFAVAAMAGAVDINSVAPGMAAALLCTAAGLGVAIPALFGYNWLAARSEAISADMTVFVDEFSARLAEEHDNVAEPLLASVAANASAQHA